MRRKNYVLKLSQADELFCKIIKNCQHLSQKQAFSLLSKHRIESYIKQGALKRLHYISNNVEETAYVLTKQGRLWIERNLPHLKGHFYSSKTAVLHNISLAEQVITHIKKGHEWLNERELRERFTHEFSRIEDTQNRLELIRKLENREISVPDGACIREDGSIQCFEIVTNSYNEAAIQAKMAFSEITNIPITFIRS